MEYSNIGILVNCGKSWNIEPNLLVLIFGVVSAIIIIIIIIGLAGRPAFSQLIFAFVARQVSSTIAYVVSQQNKNGKMFLLEKTPTSWAPTIVIHQVRNPINWTAGWLISQFTTTSLFTMHFVLHCSKKKTREKHDKTHDGGQTPFSGWWAPRCFAFRSKSMALKAEKLETIDAAMARGA